MPRRARSIQGGLLCDVLNRANGGGLLRDAQSSARGCVAGNGSAHARSKATSTCTRCCGTWGGIRVNRAQTQGELEALRRAVQRGRPLGSEAWCEQIGRPSLQPRLQRHPGPNQRGDLLVQRDQLIERDRRQLPHHETPSASVYPISPPRATFRQARVCQDFLVGSICGWVAG